MTELKDVQQLTATQILAHATFAASGATPAEAVLVDDGKQETAENTALLAAGHVVTVLPILDGETIDQGGDKALVNVGVAVRIAINPEKATKNVYQLIADAKAAVLGYDGGTVKHPKNRFSLAQKAFTIDGSDPGLLAYILFFEKRCVF
jgi:hypothetical protein